VALDFTVADAGPDAGDDDAEDHGASGYGDDEGTGVAIE